MATSSPFRIVKVSTMQGIRYHLVDENLDFIDWHRDYINLLAEKKVSPCTLRNNAQALRYLALYMRERQIQLTDFDVRRDLLFGFREWLRTTTQIQDSSVNTYLRCTCAFLRQEYVKGTLSTDPIPYIESRRTFRKHGPFFTDVAQGGTSNYNGLVIPSCRRRPKSVPRITFAKVLGRANGLRDNAILVTLYEGGLRAGELLGMHVEDVDFAQRGIKVVDRLDNPNGARATRADRFVPMPDEAMALLSLYLYDDWLNISPQHDMLWVNTKSPVISQRGKWMTKSNLDSIFRTLSEKSGLHINPHMLRHSHVTNLAQGYRDRGESIDWKFISARVGHSSVVITMNTYAHLSEESNKKEYERLRLMRASK